MRKIIKSMLSLSIVKMPIDLVFALIAWPGALILRAYRQLGSAKLPLTTMELKAIGIFPIRDHYYEPLFKDSLLTKPLSDDRELPAINLNLDSQLDFLSRLTFTSELIEMKWDEKRNSSDDFYVFNNSFDSGDAEFLYQFIRLTKPSKIIEIGSGYSTKVARLALLKNFSETHLKATHTCIEPYEMPWLEKLQETTVVRSRVEECDFDWSKELSSGDLLFVDSSHMIRPQGDVLKEYLDIFPRLAAGVYIHIHDIFTPKDYLHDWVVNSVLFWNEQYLLEALLSNTNRYEIVAAMNYLKNHSYPQLKAVCPYLSPKREPGSFYIKVAEPAP